MSPSLPRWCSDNGYFEPMSLETPASECPPVITAGAVCCLPAGWLLPPPAVGSALTQILGTAGGGPCCFMGSLTGGDRHTGVHRLRRFTWTGTCSHRLCQKLTKNVHTWKKNIQSQNVASNCSNIRLRSIDGVRTRCIQQREPLGIFDLGMILDFLLNYQFKKTLTLS